MLLYEEPKKSYTKPLLIILAVVALFWAGNKYHHQKLSQAHQHSFVEGCLNVLALEFVATTGHPVPPHIAQQMVNGCVQLHRRANEVQK